MPVCIGHEAAQVGDAALVVISSAIPRGQPRAARGAPPRPARAAARRDAGPHHGHAPRRGGGRHARQDDHLVDDHPRAAALRSAADVPRGRRPERRRLQRRRGRTASGSWPRPTRATAACCSCVPRSAVVTNVELDHHANYRCLADVRDVFRRFVALLPPSGRLVVAATRAPSSSRARPKPRSYATAWRRGRRGDVRPRPRSAPTVARPTATATATDPTSRRDRARRRPRQRVRGARGRRASAASTLRVPGEHNVLNALGALAVLAHAGVELRRGGAAPGHLQRRRAPLPGGRAPRRHRGDRRLRASPHRGRGHAQGGAQRLVPAGSSPSFSRTCSRARATCSASSAAPSRWPTRPSSPTSSRRAKSPSPA